MVQNLILLIPFSAVLSSFFAENQFPCTDSDNRIKASIASKRNCSCRQKSRNIFLPVSKKISRKIFNVFVMKAESFLIPPAPVNAVQKNQPEIQIVADTKCSLLPFSSDRIPGWKPLSSIDTKLEQRKKNRVMEVIICSPNRINCQKHNRGKQ